MIYEILFLCSANVGRSQMAEGYYNYYTKSNLATSAALIEDRKEKFGNRPDKIIEEIMKEDGINISKQRIKLLTDNLCKKANKIILLFDPYGKNIRSEFTINDLNAVDFLKNNYGKKIIIMEINDPYGKNKKEAIKIRNKIKELVKKFI